MENSAMQSQRSMSSISTAAQSSDQHGAGSSSNPNEFVNQGLLLWNQTRQQWVGNRRHNSQNQKPRQPKISSKDEDLYRLRFEVPGLGKDDVRVAVEDGVLVIQGEKRVEKHGGGDDDEWWASSFGCYEASLVLPDDAREGITAEVKDGVLYVTVPRVPERRRSVTEVKVQ